jgi:hypothetical protein
MIMNSTYPDPDASPEYFPRVRFEPALNRHGI